MHKEGIKGFPYYVGIDSLDEIATKDDTVCVLNIVGGESRAVTPVSHVYSGGNIVFGTSPGRSGQKLKTSIGDIPVYNSVKEGLDAGHKFNTAVIYLPPSGVKDGVAEVVRKNPDLKKVIILTEKICVKDSRIIRAICQTNGVDVFGGNCLGVADSVVTTLRNHSLRDQLLSFLTQVTLRLPSLFTLERKVGEQLPPSLQVKMSTSSMVRKSLIMHFITTRSCMYCWTLEGEAYQGMWTCGIACRFRRQCCS
jgi:hypothetical protein